MASGAVLELASLPELHPQLRLLHLFGEQAIIRLCLDPVELSGCVRRTIVVDHRGSGMRDSIEIEREIDWERAGIAIDNCKKTKNSINAHEITEEAAVAVMSLLIHNLENVVLQGVLQIGSGGDYSICLDSKGKMSQIEVSGIRDGTESLSWSHLREKKIQVLKHSPHGFASVTTFQQSPRGIVHSFLHFVELSGETS